MMLYEEWYVFSPTVLCANNWSRIILAVIFLSGRNPVMLIYIEMVC